MKNPLQFAGSITCGVSAFVLVFAAIGIPLKGDHVQVMSWAGVVVLATAFGFAGISMYLLGESLNK